MTAKRTAEAETAKAIWSTLRSPNESDSNYEPANVVDGLFALARATRDAGADVAEALRELAAAVRGSKP
jgi:hypothetical protein